MNKENKSAAGQRRSAIAERIRLREEWKELKGRESHHDVQQNKNILTKKQTNKTAINVQKNMTSMDRHRKQSTRNTQQIDSILCGVVALVEVGSESRALPLRAALAALGASVLPAWSPLVTHLVWSQGGCRSTRARGRALACRLVSPLWVEACASASRRLPEQAFPAAARPSDLPSPKTLQRLLKKAEMENIPLADLLSDSAEGQKQFRLRISSETEQDTSVDTDTSGDESRDMTKDTSNETLGVKSQEKQKLPAALPTQSEPPPPAKSRRKIFTHKEADDSDSMDSDENTPVPVVKRPSYHPAGKQKPKTTKKQTLQKDRKELARAERLAKKIVTGCNPAASGRGGPARPGRGLQREDTPIIVLTGMSRSERRLVSAAVRPLGARVQRSVDKRTTHVLMGTFLHDDEYNRTAATGIPTLPSTGTLPTNPKPRTLNALSGAARGCRVLYAQWAMHSKEASKWMHYYGYEVPHLQKISEKARVQRSAFGKVRCEYGYDVFCGMRVCVSRDVTLRESAAQLLQLCGAELHEDKENCNRPRPQNVPTQNGGRTQAGILTQNGDRTEAGFLTQNGGLKVSQYYVRPRPECEYDVRVGLQSGDVTSKWVFDSVAAGRMRNTRRYLITDSLFEDMERLGC